MEFEKIIVNAAESLVFPLFYSYIISPTCPQCNNFVEKICLRSIMDLRNCASNQKPKPRVLRILCIFKKRTHSGKRLIWRIRHAKFLVLIKCIHTFLYHTTFCMDFEISRFVNKYSFRLYAGSYNVDFVRITS